MRCDGGSSSRFSSDQMFCKTCWNNSHNVSGVLTRTLSTSSHHLSPDLIASTHLLSLHLSWSLFVSSGFFSLQPPVASPAATFLDFLFISLVPEAKHSHTCCSCVWLWVCVTVSVCYCVCGVVCASCGRRPFQPLPGWMISPLSLCWRLEMTFCMLGWGGWGGGCQRVRCRLWCTLHQLEVSSLTFTPLCVFVCVCVVHSFVVFIVWRFGRSKIASFLYEVWYVGENWCRIKGECLDVKVTYATILWKQTI